MPNQNVHRLFAFLSLPLVLAAGTSATWFERGDAFHRGTPGESGHNLYVNRHGELEVIRRFDLDENGHLDLLFNSTHDTDNALPASIVRFAGQNIDTRKLEIDGSSEVVPGDFNADGFADLAFLPNRPNVQHGRNSLIVAWGSAHGWSTRRISRQLPVNGATRLAAGDVNGDGWKDLVTLNSGGWLFGQPDGTIVRTYWGGEDGFVLMHHHDLGVADAIDLAVGSFDDGKARLAVLTTDGTIELCRPEGKELVAHDRFNISADTDAKPTRLLSGAEVGMPHRLWVATSGDALFEIDAARLPAAVRRIPAAPATHLSVGNLDGDAQPDLVLTDRSLMFPLGQRTKIAPSVTVMWGGPTGLSTGKTALDIPNASAAGAGDVDGDGHAELLVAVFQGEESQAAQSLVFRGTGARQFGEPAWTVPTEGAEGVAVARLRDDAMPAAIFANSQRRTLDDHVPLPLYWGTPEGFSVENSVKIPNLSGNNSGGADLNGDGFLDLYTVNGSDISPESAARAPHSGIIIYWGGREGAIAGPGPNRFDLTRRQVLTEFHVAVANAADLNRDGYLDLVLGAYESGNRPNTELIIYYGSAEGYSRERRKTVPVPGRSVTELVADANGDGWLDVVITSYTTNEVITLWGGPDGFSEKNRHVLPYPAPIESEAADLNGDGWLDLLIASYEDPVSGHNDMGVTTFWGGEQGWQHSNSFWLPGLTPLGIAVGDLDDDGWLDIVVPSYHGELTRENIPSYIFWGSEDGFAPLRRTALMVDSASDAMLADFNGDGRKDIAFSAHSVDRGHVAQSPIYFNDGNRFANPQVQYLPATGPHFMWIRDVGNIAHRRYEESFTSQPLAWERSASSVRVDFDAATPAGSRVAIEVRSARSPAGLAQARWKKVQDRGTEIATVDRALQYRLTLYSPNGDAYPRVRSVSVTVQ